MLWGCLWNNVVFSHGLYLPWIFWMRLHTGSHTKYYTPSFNFSNHKCHGGFFSPLFYTYSPIHTTGVYAKYIKYLHLPLKALQPRLFERKRILHKSLSVCMIRAFSQSVWIGFSSTLAACPAFPPSPPSPFDFQSDNSRKRHKDHHRTYFTKNYL